MIKTCEICGKPFEARAVNAKYCDTCRPVVNREHDRRYHQQVRRANNSICQRDSNAQRTCRQCGQEFTVQYNEYTCPTCKAIQYEKDLAKRRERQRRLYAQKKVDETQGKPGKTLDDWAREADDCNLDYGTYRALIAAGRTFEQLKADRRSPQFHSHCHSVNKN